MKSNNLTITIPTPPCRKNCPFCISKMTEHRIYNKSLYWRNIKKLKYVAVASQVSNILLTGKGEPTDNMRDTLKILKMFDNSGIPLEIQTNGINLNKNFNLLKKLYKAGLNVLAISISHPSELKTNESMIIAATKIGLTVRLTLVLSYFWQDYTPDIILEYCEKNEVSQLTFRLPTVPINYVETKESVRIKRWIEEQSKLKYNEEFLEKLYRLCNNKNLVRSLSFGSNIYDIKGVGVTTIDYCIQENSKNDDIRSLIYQTDGHLYTTWDKKGSILF